MKPKVKLKKFTAFSKEILPHEAMYLQSKEVFVDAEKKAILYRLIDNVLESSRFVPFDAGIDKRKYSYIKAWIEKKLQQIDVDKITAWLMRLKEKIQLDAISAEEERDFLQYIVHYQEVDYNFTNVYDLAQEYQAYLLIRMRYNDHETLSGFLEEFHPHYHKAKEIQQQLYKATKEITNQYTQYNHETIYWEKWLRKVFETQQIDGKNRYQAFILLAFMYSNYNESDKLKTLFDTIDNYFATGLMYSRRILCNYYASRLLLHAKRNEQKVAEYYGFLSIRHYNNDTMMYVNNLVAILLKNKKEKLALSILEEYNGLYNQIHNYHQKIGFCSYKIRVFNALKKHQLAENLAKNFLSQYKHSILKLRWHHFFTSYFNSLIALEKYGELLQLAKKFKLEEKEQLRRKKPNYVPNISWSISLSRYMEGRINADTLFAEIKKPLPQKPLRANQKALMFQVIDQFAKNLPEVFQELKSHVL